MNYINDLFVKCSGNSDKLKKSIHKRLGKGERIKFASAVRKLESVFKTESTKSVIKALAFEITSRLYFKVF